MLPPNEWLPDEINQLQPPIDAPVPGGLVLEYWEGADGQIDVPSNQTFRVFEDLFVASFITRRIGYSGSLDRVLHMTFNQLNVFGVLLLDAFRPPEIAQELFDYVPAPVEGGDLPVVGGGNVTHTPVEGSASTYTTITGTATSWQA